MCGRSSAEENLNPMKKKFSLLLLLLLVSQFILLPGLIRPAWGDIDIDIEDAVDNDTSDVDFNSDIGTSSNFTAQKYGPDSVFDTLTEENVQTLTEILYVDAFSATVTEWSTFGASPYLDNNVSNYVYENTDKDEIEWFNFTAPSGGTVDSVYLYVEAYESIQDATEYIKVYFEGVNPSVADVDPSGMSYSWYSYDVSTWLTTLDDITQCRMQLFFKGKGGSSIYVRRAYLNVTYLPIYNLDLEVQWTGVDSSHLHEYLCINGGMMGAENIGVDIWYSSSWNNVLTDLTPGWNNVSIGSYLDSSTFTIRLKGGTETSDATQDTWQIDTSLLHLWNYTYQRYPDERLQINAIPSITFPKEAFQNLFVKASAFRTFTNVRLPDQAIDVVAQPIREASQQRYASQNVLISAVAETVKTFMRDVQQSLTVITQVMRTRTSSSKTTPSAPASTAS